jgi:hypothetical protein
VFLAKECNALDEQVAVSTHWPPGKLGGQAFDKSNLTTVIFNGDFDSYALVVLVLEPGDFLL